MVTVPESRSVTGRFLYARHAGDAEVEYVEWTPEVLRHVMDATA